MIAQPLFKGGKSITMKHFIKIITSLIIILSLVGCMCNVNALVPAYTVPNTNYTYDDIDTLIELMAEQISNMNAAHQMADAARQLGYDDEHDVIVLAREEWTNANNERIHYEAIYNNLMEHWQQKEEEYPEASYIWSYLKKLGYNNYVCAGILGNIMTEVGGNTLAVQPLIYGKGYYGMCQWSKWYSSIWGQPLDKQCDFLRDTIKYELDTYGSIYKKSFNYDKFLELKDCQQAALAFAKAYERCGSGSYKLRQQNAITAYNYFVS